MDILLPTPTGSGPTPAALPGLLGPPAAAATAGQPAPGQEAAGDGAAAGAAGAADDGAGAPCVPGDAAGVLAADRGGAGGAGALLPPADAVPLDQPLPVPRGLGPGRRDRGEAPPHRPLHRAQGLRDAAAARGPEHRGGDTRRGQEGQEEGGGGGGLEEEAALVLKGLKSKSYNKRKEKGEEGRR
ncbi:hypothetical protein TruAng_005125 [Truncatella angustata]|nr:hypothetical protein TruAng_005125 [Truncatella angustata]